MPVITTTPSVTEWLVLARSAAGASGAEDTNENALATITVPANAMGPNGFLRITTAWVYTNSANAKTLRYRFSGIAGTIFWTTAPTTTALTTHSFIIANRNAANSQTGMMAGGSATPWSANTGTLVTGAVDTTAETTLVLTGQKALGTETLTLVGYVVELAYGA